MNLVNNRWSNGFDAATVAKDMEEIGPLGIVRSLVRQRRFFPSGPPCDEYNVASHLVLVSMVFLKIRGTGSHPKLAFPGPWPMEWLANCLLHDAHEAFTSDIVSPVKNRLQGVKELEEGIDIGLRHYFDVFPTMSTPAQDVVQAVKICDYVALLLEAEEFDLCLEQRPEEVPDEVMAGFKLCGGKTWKVRQAIPVGG